MNAPKVAIFWKRWQLNIIGFLRKYFSISGILHLVIGFQIQTQNRDRLSKTHINNETDYHKQRKIGGVGHGVCKQRVRRLMGGWNVDRTKISILAKPGGSRFAV